MAEPSPPDPIDVSVLLVSFNTRDLTLRCLQRLLPDLAAVSGEVILVDNASHDGSPEAVRAAFPGVRVIDSPRNLGFGAANNLAIRHARGRFLMLLNTDALVEPGTTHGLLGHLEAHPEAAVAGPKLLNPDGSTQPSCYAYPTPGRAWLENLGLIRLFKPGSRWGDTRRWPHDRTRAVAWVVGACLLVRREVVEQVGGFDERFFLYAEETDWQKRIRDAGWSIRFTPEARVTHLGGASGASDRPRVHRLFFESIDLYQLKHHGVAGLVAFRLGMAAGSLARLPLWLAAFAVRPGLRDRAMGKLRLHGWLFRRQLLTWPRARGGEPA